MFETFVKCILQSSLICSIGIVFILILRKSLFNYYSQSFKYYIWLTIIIKLLIPFKIPIYVSQNLYNDFSCSSNIINLKSSVISNTNIAYPISNYNKTINCFEILFYFWLFGILVFLIYHFYVYMEFVNKIKYLSSDISENKIISIYLKLIDQLEIKSEITLKYCTGINSPLGIGFLKKYILIPQNIYSDEEIYWILKHELLHFKRHDLKYKFILLIVQAIHWFNPLVYLMLKIIDSDCELSCDEIILKDSCIELRKFYAITFIDSIKQNRRKVTENMLTTGFCVKQNELKRRVENMLNLKIKRKGMILGISAMLLVASSFISINAFAKDNLNSSTKTSISIQNNAQKILSQPKSQDQSIVTSDKYSEALQEYMKNNPDKFDKDHPTKILQDFMKEKNLDHLTVDFTAPVTK